MTTTTVTAPLPYAGELADNPASQAAFCHGYDDTLAGHADHETQYVDSPLIGFYDMGTGCATWDIRQGREVTSEVAAARAGAVFAATKQPDPIVEAWRPPVASRKGRRHKARHRVSA